MSGARAAVGAVALLLIGGGLYLRTPPEPEAAGSPPVQASLQGDSLFPPSAWARADDETVRLSPDAFPEVPPAVRGELKRRGCTVPQTYGIDGLHNVISGRFTSAAATDWAALCSRDGATSLLVFPGASAEAAMELSSSPDAEWLQTIGANAIGFSRAISVASADDVRREHRRSGGAPLPPLDHEGIDQAFIENMSDVLYWHDGRWLELHGVH